MGCGASSQPSEATSSQPAQQSGGKIQLVVTSCDSEECSGIHTLQLDLATGELVPLYRLQGLDEAYFAVPSPRCEVVYVAYAPGDVGEDKGYVAALSIDPNSGALAIINQQHTQGTTTCYVDIDPAAQALVFSNYSSASVGSLAIRQSDGGLEPVSSLQQHDYIPREATSPTSELFLEGGLHYERQDTPHPHCAHVSSDGQFVHCCDLGNDQVTTYAFEASSAMLKPISHTRTVLEGGPRHMISCGSFAYIDHELSNSISVYSYEKNTGGLGERLQLISTLPEGFKGKSWIADLQMHPKGFLFCSNRGHDSIVVFKVHKTSGLLELVETVPSAGSFPQDLCLTPDGKFLLCANMGAGDSDDEKTGIAVFRISVNDTASSLLELVGEPLTMDCPSCIVIAPPYVYSHDHLN